jgi:hypothetical protein
MGLRDLFRRKPRQAVVIDPVQAIALEFLFRFERASHDDLFAEVENERPVPREVFTAAIADAAAQGLVDYRLDPEASSTTLVLTPLGGRLRGRLPANVQSRVSVYL